MDDQSPGQPTAPTADNAQKATPIVVAIRGTAASAQTVQGGQRLAVAAGHPWYVVHVTRPSLFRRATATRNDTLTRAFALAERLGGRTAMLRGRSVASGLRRFAAREGATLIVVGQSQPRLCPFPRKTLAQTLRRGTGPVDVHVIARRVGTEGGLREMRSRAMRLARAVYPYLVGATVAVGATVFVPGLQHRFNDIEALGMPIVAGIVLVALRYGLGPGLYTTLLGVGLFGVFLTPVAGDRLTADSIATLACLGAVGAGVSYYAGRIHRARAMGETREARLRALFRFGRDIGAAAGAQDVLRAIVEQIDDILGARTVVLLPTGPEGLLQVAYPSGAELPASDAEAAEWAYHFDDLAGHGTNTIEEAMRLYHPMRGPEQPIGALGIGDVGHHDFHDPEYRWLLEALAGLAAIAIERADLSRRMADARVLAEADSLRAALLSSISHDLRTPLATIVGSASTLQSYGANLDAETRRDLLAAIREEAERLNRFIRNLLEMAKLEVGAVIPKRQWVALEEIIGAALERLGKLLHNADVRTEIMPEMPLAYVDFVQIEQVLVILLENAIAYSPAGAPVTLSATADPEASCFRISVSDHGAGIEPRDLPHIFDKFYRAQYRDRKIAGTGLGLSICKGLIEAHGGAIRAESEGRKQGARFSIELPFETGETPARHGTMNAERA
jgi:two-component system sensor histidine kinase KdpD